MASSVSSDYGLLESLFPSIPIRILDAIEMGKSGMDRDMWEAIKELDKEFPGLRENIV